MQTTVQRAETQPKQNTTDITYLISDIIVQTSINLKKDLLDSIDEARGTQSRSSYIVETVAQRLSGGDADKKQLIAELEMAKNEVAFLREQNSKLLDAIAVKLLSGPKRHWWSRR